MLVVDNRALAERVGTRIRNARRQAGLTQAELAAGRYTSAYISALELGHAKPSMAALSFLAERLGLSPRDFLDVEQPASARLEADLALAAGRWQEALDRYQLLLDANPVGRVRAELLRGMAEALCRLDRGSEAIGPAAEAAEAFSRMDLATDAAWSKYWLAFAHYRQDNPAEARSLLQELLDAERGGLNVAPDFRFRLLTAVANVEAWDGNPERALSYMEEARSLTDGLSLKQQAAFLSGLALQHHMSGDYERALRTGMQSFALYRAIESSVEHAALANNLALTYLELGNTSKAQEQVKYAEAIANAHDDAHVLSEILETKARIAWAAGDGATAERLISEVIDAAESGGSHVAQARALVTRARIARERGAFDDAGKSFAAAASILRERGPAQRVRQVLAEWADLLTAQGEFAAANRLYAEALGR